MGARLGPRLRAILLGVAAAAAAAGFAALGRPVLGDAGYLILLPVAVAGVAWLEGAAAALLTATAGYLACRALVPGLTGVLPDASALLPELPVYAAYCLLVIVLGAAARRAHQREREVRDRDDAERRRAEESGAALAAIVETSDDAIVSKSLDGIIRSWNPGAERLFGYTAAQAVGQPITMIVPPELQDEETAILGQLRRGQRVEPFETVRLTREGRRIHVSLAISPVRDGTGRIVGASKIARDITVQKRADAALRFSEERFRELANHIDQFAWTCDRQGRVTWYNQRWYDYSGATIEDMRGDGWRRFHHPAHVDRVDARQRRSVTSGEPWEDTYPLRGKDGEYRWFLTRAIPIRDERGDVIRWFGTNTDVTEQRQLAQELTAADRRKDEFLATLAHELRNPLAPIRNAVEILNLAGDDAALIGEARAIINRQMSHMVRLVDDLLDVSRITRDRLELRRVDVELNALVTETVESHRGLLQEQGLEIAVSLAPEALRLNADPVRVAQILSNLLNNAGRCTPSGGRVTICVESQERDVLLRVRDTGVGIPPEQLHEIFGMFSQVRDGRPGQGGLGIGLTLVKRLAELHGGAAWAHSDGPGTGSEFVVRLPLAAAPAAAPAELAPTYAATRPRRVLVVEDNPDTAATLGTLLEMAGHQTEIAGDGAQAMKLAAQFRPEVVLLDLGLPKLNGIEVCRWIRTQPWGGAITVVAVTGWGQDSDRRRTRQAGFDRHLVKPVSPEALLNLVADPAGAAASA